MPSGENYSVPDEASNLLLRGIIQNPLIKDLPENAAQLCGLVKFEGHTKPSIPINWRFSESIAALKGFESVMLNDLLTRKYGIAPVDVTINTDHASLFFMSSLVAQVVQDGKPTPYSPLSPLAAKLFPSQDLHRSQATLHRQLATNIYKTRDNRYYHVHGSMNPDHCLTALGLPLEGEDTDTYESIAERIQAAVSQHNAADLDELMNEQYRQAGTIAYTADEYFATEQGKNDVGLYEIHKDSNSTQPAGWWPENSSMPSSPKRPLAGLKVVDLTRIIAGPSLSRSLAELGASVMRIVSPHVTDMTPLHQDLNWGKWNAFLHLKDEANKEKLRALIRGADVVVDGYRVALNYYSQWLVKSCGTYPPAVWEELFTRHGSPVFRHYHTMLYSLPVMLKTLHEQDAGVLFKPKFFEARRAKNLATTFVVPKPVLRFPGGEVQPGYTIGTRKNGTDLAYWPKNLKTEVIRSAA